jgi:hypothetical protein
MNSRINPFLAQVLYLERKCIDVRGMFDEEAAKGILLPGVVICKKPSRCV